MDRDTQLGGGGACAVIAAPRDPAFGCLIMDLPFSHRAAEAARRAVAAALTGSAAGQLLDDALLVSSELATNGYQSGSPPLVFAIEWTADRRRRQTIELTLTDGGCGHSQEHLTAAKPPADDAEKGRGLVLVQAVAAAWSLTVGADTTCAWCLLQSTEPEAGADGRSLLCR